MSGQGAPLGLVQDARTTLLQLLSAHTKAHDEALARSLEDITPETRRLCELLFAAVISNDDTLVCRLLGQGVSPNLRSAEGCTPLHLSVEQGLAGISMMLAHAGADLEARAGSMSFTPLLMASAYGQTEVALALIELGADVNVLGTNGATPLSCAAGNNDVRLVLALVKTGAVVDSLSGQGLTPLHIATCSNNLKVVSVLVRHGANPSTPDPAGNTPLMTACLRGYLDCAQLLLACGADPRCAAKV